MKKVNRQNVSVQLQRRMGINSNIYLRSSLNYNNHVFAAMLHSSRGLVTFTSFDNLAHPARWIGARADQRSGLSSIMYLCKITRIW